MFQSGRGDRQDGEGSLIDQKRILVGAVLRTAVLDHVQAARADLIRDPVAEKDDAVADILFKALAGQHVDPGFAGDDGGHAFLLEPAKETTDFGSQEWRVGQVTKERFDGIEYHSLGTDGVDRVAEADEETFQIVFAGLFDLAALDGNGINHEFLAPDQVLEVKSERLDVPDQLLFALLERHKDARLIVQKGTIHQKLHSQHRLATACAATDKGGPPFWQSTAGDFIQSENARGRLGELRSVFCFA